MYDLNSLYPSTINMMTPSLVKKHTYTTRWGREVPHNDYGPSLIYDNDQIEWWWKGKWCGDIEEYAWYSGMSEESKVMLLLKYGKSVSAMYSIKASRTSSTGPK